MGKPTLCPNCGRIVSCGCQKRISIKGTPCCNICVSTVNEKERLSDRLKS